MFLRDKERDKWREIGYFYRGISLDFLLYFPNELSNSYIIFMLGIAY